MRHMLLVGMLTFFGGYGMPKISLLAPMHQVDLLALKAKQRPCISRANHACTTFLPIILMYLIFWLLKLLLAWVLFIHHQLQQNEVPPRYKALKRSLVLIVTNFVTHYPPLSCSLVSHASGDNSSLPYSFNAI